MTDTTTPTKSDTTTAPRITRALVAPARDYLDNRPQAVHVANLAYADAERRGATPEALYDVYHDTYTDTLRELGTPAPCCCQRCQALAAGAAP